MPIIAVEDIEHVRYQATDLDRMEQFLTDFGLTRAARGDDVLHMRAASGAHAVHITERGNADKAIGFGLRAQSLNDLRTLAAHTGGKVEPCTEPGGGQRVRVVDPAGFQVDVIHRADVASAAACRAAHVRNTGDRRERVGQTVRQPRGPSQVVRLGHIVLLVPRFEPVYAFYNQVLGLEISDSYHMQDPAETTFAFLHCGLGERYTDHHTVALGSPPGGIDHPRFDHVAFEVVDLDDLMAGNAWLKDRGWKHSWGVGRHILGSQLFDYWRDPFGNKIEHWTDGDLVNDRYPPSHGPISPDTLAQWAPPLTPEFFE